MESRRIELKSCKVCNRSFVPRFSFQVVTNGSHQSYYCSQRCLLKDRASNNANQPNCSICGQSFTLEYAYQRSVVNGQTQFFCSESCSDAFKNRCIKPVNTKRLAILNQKGGTGKTTTAVNLAAGFAMRGFSVLLIDMDAQGNVGVSLGLSGNKGTYNLLIENSPASICTVPIRNNLDIITSNESLAAAEIQMASMENRELRLKQAMIDNGGESGYDYVIMDCPPSLSLVNQNALVYADEVLVPVSCDFLAMVGVKQILRTLDRMNNLMGHPVSICGVLPTFYDIRTKLSSEVLRNIREYFKDKALPPIRVNTRLKEAPSHKQTIFEYAPKSNAAEDYLRVVECLLEK